MPLSEHEQKLLEQMERALYAEDPGFATQMKGAVGRGSRGRFAVGVLAVIGGLVVVLFGVNLSSIPVGVIGFLIMLGGAAWAWSPSQGSRQRTSSERPAAGRPVKPGKSARPRKQRGTAKGSFMQRMEHRWERRRRQGM